jgi:hypothetical protein
MGQCWESPDEPLLRRSLNYRTLLNGHAYPLFYDTLFADLRSALTTAADNARSAGKHLWPRDRSQDGLTVADQADLEQDGAMFPKLFRRLTEFFTEPHAGLADFLDWLQKTEEQVFDLVANNLTHFDNVVAVTGSKVRLTRRPEQIVFVSAKTASPVVALARGLNRRSAERPDGKEEGDLQFGLSRSLAGRRPASRLALFSGVARELSVADTPALRLLTDVRVRLEGHLAAYIRPPGSHRLPLRRMWSGSSSISRPTSRLQVLWLKPRA